MEQKNPYANFGAEPAEPPASPHHSQPVGPAADMTWPILLHLSLFAGYVVPLAGFIAPLVIWLTMKDESPEIDAHGRVVVNWIITSVIWWAIALALCLVFIGIPLVIFLGAISVIFPIIGAVKASNGQLWKYPTSIAFF
ncbi:DUF4870 domain-containing protein [Botrimarina mediterranea]|uniref:Chloroplast import component protein (Tic20) n=1 Tax=Botrimarina mediterranea TaxID=2528022 RepID=A0A518K2R0_9BACT|nr:DUF4870 domain-containing protein [Botrimarina mediterranea]QDV72081.1 hypothetical protein Spa11_02510 [Botrimarina mediterranea]QDV76622.1 hypothetical protein K2D_02010 [Planctomycetes bacterium K2D]